MIDGNRTLGRNFALANGGNEKWLAATNAGTGVTLFGAVNFGTADNVKLTATAAGDCLTFSGAMSGGVAAGRFSVSQLGNDLFLNYAVVPGPSTRVRLACMGLVGTWFLRQQRTGR